MREIRVFLADDEPLARRIARDLLIRYDDLTVVGEAGSGTDAVGAIRRSGPDLVILDVQMPDLDGFGVLRALAPEIPPAIVLVTAYDEFAVSAFDVQVVDFVVKPFVDARFYQAVDRARQWLAIGRAADVTHYRSRLMVSTGRHAVSLPVTSIAWIEADDYYARVHVQGTSYLLRQSLRRLERQLDPRLFVRIHRSALVNIGHVRTLCRPAGGSYAIVLHDNTRLPIGERRRRAVLHALGGESS